MIEVVVSIEVDRPADEVFAFLADWSNNPQWQNGMERCTWTSQPPLRVGSTYDQEARFLGRPIISSFEVVEHDPGRRVRMVTTRSTMPLDITRDVEPLGDDRARVTATIRGGPEGLLSLFDPLTKRMVRRNVEADYARLRDVLEGHSTRRRPEFGQEYRSGGGYLVHTTRFSRRPPMRPIGPPDDGWPDHPLRAEHDGSVADWWVDHYAPWTHPGVGAYVPDAFEAYAVVLPQFLVGEDRRRATWAQVAEQWDTTPGALARGEEPWMVEKPVAHGRYREAHPDAPDSVDDRDVVERLLPHLRRATTTPDDVLVARWIGFGGEALDLRFPGCAYLDTEGRGHALLRGRLEDVMVGINRDWEVVTGVWWPADRAWFVHQEVDAEQGQFEVAGSRALVDALLADEDLEVVEVTHTTNEQDHL